MTKHYTPDTYLQVGRAEEMYATPYRCMTCKGTWSGEVNHNPAFPGEYPGVFRFCPCCGIKFAGQLERLSEEREQRRCDAGWKCHDWAKAQEITYVIQRRQEWSNNDHWQADDHYFPRGTRQEVLRAWRQRLHEGSWFGEEVRLLARLPSGTERVVFGPVVLAPDTQPRTQRVWHMATTENVGLQKEEEADA